MNSAAAGFQTSPLWPPCLGDIFARCRHPRTMPLAMMTMIIRMHDLSFSMVMGLRSPALQAVGASSAKKYGLCI